MISRVPTDSGRWSAVFLPAIIPLVILVFHGRAANEHTYHAAGLTGSRYALRAPRMTRPLGVSNDLFSPPYHRFPRPGEQVISTKVVLSIGHARDSSGNILPCEFALYGDPGLRDLLCSSGSVQPGIVSTSWEVPSTLETGHTYWWRARMSDGSQTGRWSIAQMFMMVAEPVASAPSASSP